MYIGLDIGGTNIKSIITDKDGNILQSHSQKTGKTKSEILTNILSSITSVMRQANCPKRNIRAVGIGSAGVIDNKNGVIIKSPNIAAWKNYPLAEILKAEMGIPVYLENDAAVAVIGEWWKGNGAGYKNWIMLTLGTGIGGGAVVNGQLLTGRDGFACEFGHTTIDYNGEDCACGSKGCFEKYASATGFVNLTLKMLHDNKDSTLHDLLKEQPLTTTLICDEAKKKDPLCAAALEKFSFYLGVGIANMLNIFNPEAVVIGGGLSKAYKQFLPLVKKTVQIYSFKAINNNVQFYPVKDEKTGPALGAVKYAIDKQHGNKQ